MADQTPLIPNSGQSTQFWQLSSLTPSTDKLKFTEGFAYLRKTDLYWKPHGYAEGVGIALFDADGNLNTAENNGITPVAFVEDDPVDGTYLEVSYSAGSEVRFVRINRVSYAEPGDGLPEDTLGALRVDFENSSGLRKEDLQTAYEQSLFLAQESNEWKERNDLSPDSPYRESLLYQHGTAVDAITENVWLIFFSGLPAGPTNPLNTAQPDDYYVMANGELVTPDEYSGEFYNGVGGYIQLPYDRFGGPDDPSPVAPTFYLQYLKNYASAVASVGNGAVGTTQLADEAVTEPKLADNAVTTDKIADGSITASKLDPGALGGTVSSDDTIEGDGSVGDPLSIEGASHTEVLDATRFLSRAPNGSDAWSVYEFSGTGTDLDDTFGIECKFDGSALTSPVSRVFVEATTDILLNLNHTRNSTGSVNQTYVWVSNAASPPGSGIPDSSGLVQDGYYRWATPTGKSEHLQCVIPKGLFYCIGVLNQTGGNLIAHKLPITHT